MFNLAKTLSLKISKKISSKCCELIKLKELTKILRRATEMLTNAKNLENFKLSPIRFCRNRKFGDNYIGDIVGDPMMVADFRCFG